MAKATALGGDVSNGAESAIGFIRPYRMSVRIVGVADILFHAWNCDSVAAKANSAKGSTAKKTDDVDSYVHRNDDGELCIPGEYLRMAIVQAAKYRQDPRSPRKSAMDVVKATVLCLTPLASLGTKDWSYVHKCRVQVQRNGVTRMRPAMAVGWEAEFVFLVNRPDYVPVDMLRGLLNDAGILIGIGDFRPTYGRFQVVSSIEHAD